MGKDVRSELKTRFVLPFKFYSFFTLVEYLARLNFAQKGKFKKNVVTFGNNDYINYNCAFI